MVPFGLHQAMEYLLGAVLAATALHSYGTAMGVLAALAGLLALLAAVSGPPLGGWQLLGRRAHHRADLALIALVALSPILPGRTGVWVIVAEAVAVVGWRLERVTRYRPTVAPAPPHPVDRPTLRFSAEAVPGTGAEPTRPGPARVAGRAVGRGRASAGGALDRLPGRARRAGFLAARLAGRMAEKRRQP